MQLNKNQESVRDAIIAYGRKQGFSDQQVQIAVETAYIESSLGDQLKNPKSTATGLFQYLDDTWDTYILIPRVWVQYL